MLSHNPLDKPVVARYAVAILSSWVLFQEVCWWCPGCLMFLYGVLVMFSWLMMSCPQYNSQVLHQCHTGIRTIFEFPQVVTVPSK